MKAKVKKRVRKVSTHTLVKRVYNLLKKETRWTRGTLARDKDSWSCDPESKKAVRWCIRGAIYKLCPDLRTSIEVNEALHKAKPPSLKDYGIMAINDWHGGYKAIMSILKRAVKQTAPRKKDK